MKKRILETSNRIYGIIIGLLGFSLGCQSCGLQADMYGPPPAPEYGSPHAKYIISGKVNNADNAPIKGIEIKVKDIYDDTKHLTDESGNYKLEYTNSLTKTLEITYKDIDGVENGGEFQAYTEKIILKDEDFVGGSGNWYDGKVEKTVNIVMQEKTEQLQ